ncbi:hypothetical protein ACP70R_048819 [Stipagrostis hirtigluma subsp. patula]
MVNCASSDALGDAAAGSRWPPSILLGDLAHVGAGGRNATTATAESESGHTVEFTFWVADAPAVSSFTFHCSQPPGSDPEDAGLDVPPHVVAAEGRFFLVRARFASGDGEFDYFMYRADAGSPPSLERVPLPEYDGLDGVDEFGIVPRGGGGGGHYLLDALCDKIMAREYRLEIYSSEDGTWRTEQLPNPRPGDLTITPAKVITLREGVLGWVDFRRGMLMCDLFQSPVASRYIPLPEPLPENRQKLEVCRRGADLRRFRDLTCTDGVIKFIEMEHRVIVTEIREAPPPPPPPPQRPSEPSLESVLYDSDLIASQEERKEDDIKPKILRSMDGWSAVTWTRAIESNCWLKGYTFDVDDISVEDSAHLAFASGLPSGNSLRSLAFRDLYSAWPVLSTDGGNLLLAPLFLQTLMLKDKEMGQTWAASLFASASPTRM